MPQILPFFSHLLILSHKTIRFPVVHLGPSPHAIPVCKAEYHLVTEAPQKEDTEGIENFCDSLDSCVRPHNKNDLVSNLSWWKDRINFFFAYSCLLL